MGKTSIEWTDFSINPIRARDPRTGRRGHFCEKISAGCKNCYASRMQSRFGMHEFVATNQDKVEVWFDDSKLHEVVRRHARTKWFWCDMTDMFGEWVSDEWLDKCFATMARTPWHVHQILTKRPQRMYQYFERLSRLRMCGFDTEEDVARWSTHEDFTNNTRFLYRNLWPIPGVWLGVSCEDQKTADERIPWLLKTPAAVRFVSYEPALGPVDFGAWIEHRCPQIESEDGIPELMCDDPNADPCPHQDERLSLCIVGGESGPHARPFDIEWARSVIRQCQGTGTKVFVKQLGAWPFDGYLTAAEFVGGGKGRPRPADQPLTEAVATKIVETSVVPHARFERFLKLKDRKGGAMEEWPEDLRVREMPV